MPKVYVDEPKLPHSIQLLVPQHPVLPSEALLRANSRKTNHQLWMEDLVTLPVHQDVPYNLSHGLMRPCHYHIRLT